jgi:serine phosphatase RsbU (regulator of sigma subunit)
MWDYVAGSATTALHHDLNPKKHRTFPSFDRAADVAQKSTVLNRFAIVRYWPQRLPRSVSYGDLHPKGTLLIAMQSIEARQITDSPGWSIRQSSTCGGDFAGVLAVPRGRTAFFVGDVTGHGIAAGEKARNISTQVQQLLKRGYTPSAVLSRLDTDLDFGDGFGPFATLFAAFVDPEKRRLYYSSAGHPTALVFAGRRHVHLEPTGPLLGLRMREVSAFAERAVSLPPRAMLVVTTDGVSDARSPNRPTNFFGSGGVARSYQHAIRHDDEPAAAIYSASRAFAGGRFEDDATVLVARLET